MKHLFSALYLVVLAVTASGQNQANPVTSTTGKILTTTANLTLGGTDGSSVAFGTGGTVLYSGGAVTSLAGTPNQITASAATGAVTLSIPTNPVFSGTALTFPGLLSIASGKTLTASNTLTIVATDGITMTTPTTSFTAARTDAANTFTGLNIFTSPAQSYTLAAGTTNVTLGASAGVLLASGSTDNVVIGNGALALNTQTNAIKNVIIGSSAAAVSNSSVQQNIVIGYSAGDHLTSGDDNILLGANVANDITSAGQNLIIGNNAANNSTYNAAGSIVLGYNACRNITAAATLCIDAIDRGANFATQSLIYGSMNATVASQSIVFNAGTTTAYHLIAAGAAPSVNTGTLATGASDMAGKVTSVTGAYVGVITFGTAYTRAPACHGSNETTIVNLVGAVSTTTTLTLTTTSVGSDVLSYVCIGY